MWAYVNIYILAHRISQYQYCLKRLIKEYLFMGKHSFFSVLKVSWKSNKTCKLDINTKILLNIYCLKAMSLLTVFSSVQIYLYYFYYQNIDFLLILEQSITILEDKKWHCLICACTYVPSSVMNYLALFFVTSMRHSNVFWHI